VTATAERYFGRPIAAHGQQPASGLPTLIVQGGYALGNLRSGSHAFFRGISEAWHD
jgi:hypothetical protein